MMKKIKNIILITLFVFTCSIGFSQNPIQGQPTVALQEEAVEYAESWAEELVLSPKQAALMEKKYIEFAIKKDDVIQSNLTKEEKTRRLSELQVLEYGDIRNILTQPQYDKYVALTTDPNTRKQNQN